MNGLTTSSLLLFIVGIGIGFVIRFIYGRTAFNSIEMKSKKTLSEIDLKFNNLEKEKNLFEVKYQKDSDYLVKEKQSLDKAKTLFQEEKQNLSNLEITLNNKNQAIEQREKQLTSLEKTLARDKEDLEKDRHEIKTALEKMAQLSKEEATDILLSQLEKDLDKEMAGLITKKEEAAKDTADLIARDILLNTMNRLSTEMTVESVVSSVTLPSDEMKGRIIGREGRNIRALETKTGVDIIIDDTPEAIIISSFDPVRREVARLTIERLISDGRIQPSRIEEIHDKVQQEIQDIIKDAGEEALYKLGILNIHPDIKKYLGRMKFRTSYGQNLLAHSIEVAQLSSMMAGDLGLNKEIAVRGGLLHDIGKIIMDDDRGHVVAGTDLAKRLGETEEVLNCIAAHHEEVEHSCPESLIVRLADAISASRPGARRDSFERYVERLSKLENIALGYKEIEKAYAIQAGRELRVIVNSIETNDHEAKLLARKIADDIEGNLRYPGQIKVSVFRENRFTEYAK